MLDVLDVLDVVVAQCLAAEKYLSEGRCKCGRTEQVPSTYNTSGSRTAMPAAPDWPGS